MKALRSVFLLFIAGLALPAFGSAKPVTLPGGETLEIWAPGADGVSMPKPRSRVPVVAVGLNGLTEPLDVRVAVVIKADGSVAAIEPYEAAPIAALQAARVALGEWEWKPAKRKGRSVDAYTVWTLRFEPVARTAAFGAPPRDAWHERQLASFHHRPLDSRSLTPRASGDTTGSYSGSSASSSPGSHDPNNGRPLYPHFPMIQSTWVNYQQTHTTIQMTTNPHDPR